MLYKVILHTKFEEKTVKFLFYIKHIHSKYKLWSQPNFKFTTSITWQFKNTQSPHNCKRDRASDTCRHFINFNHRFKQQILEYELDMLRCKHTHTSEGNLGDEMQVTYCLFSYQQFSPELVSEPFIPLLSSVF